MYDMKFHPSASFIFCIISGERSMREVILSTLVFTFWSILIRLISAFFPIVRNAIGVTDTPLPVPVP